MANIAHYFQRQLATPERVLYREFVDGAWRDISVETLARRVARWQAALTAKGLVAGDRVAICLRNGVDWVAIDLAALGLGLIVVPLYVDDNPDNVAWCAAHAEARLLLVESSRMASALARPDSERSTREIWVMHPDAGDPLPSVASMLADSEQPVRIDALDASVPATICYTSGTSGRPKGVVLTHGNIVANVESCIALGIARADDSFLSILPLSHMFERTGGYYLALAIGAVVAYARGIATIADDLVSQRPSVMFAVPRIFERFQARIDASLADAPAKRALFDQCVGRGWRLAMRSPSLLDRAFAPALRALVARPVLGRLGGRMRLAVVGGAPLDPAIARTFIGLGLPLLQGYGMTEASPVISVNRLDDNDPASVGPPLPGVEVMLGANTELLARGANVMQGYWRDPEATRAAIDDEGWLHTGDLATMREGKIYISGRAKDILVMSNGEKLSPQDAELALLHDPVFEQVMLVGEGKPFLTLLAVTRESDEQTLIRRANELLKSFPRWVRVRRVIATPDAWTVDNGLMTPTLKLKRPQVQARMKSAIDAVYAERGPA
jgi:long-chain acyl-CoA synthetase